MKQPSQKQLDAMAKQKGFADYATWSAWNAKYGSAARKKGRSQLPNEPQPRNVFEKIPIHPASILRKVSDKINAAVGNK
jgi:hypothetical protein